MSGFLKIEDLVIRIDSIESIRKHLADGGVHHWWIKYPAIRINTKEDCHILKYDNTEERNTAYEEIFKVL